MTVIQKRADNPVAHLTDADIEAIGRELDALREEEFASLGEYLQEFGARTPQALKDEQQRIATRLAG